MGRTLLPPERPRSESSVVAGALGGYARSFAPAGLPRSAHGFTRIDDGCSQEEDLQDEDPQSAGLSVEARCPRPKHLPTVQRDEGSSRRVSELRLVRRTPRHRSRVVS